MNETVVKILNENKANIDDNNFVTVFEEALKQGVANDVLAIFYEAGLSVPINQLADALKKHYIDNNPSIPLKEKSEKEKLMEHLINRYQISIFEFIMNIR